MSIDLYPALDAGETDVAVALERTAAAGRIAPLGAASLLHRNSDEHWPEQSGDDLATWYPGIEYVNLANDDATIGEVFGEQLVQLEPTDEDVLVTLTIGRGDLLSAFASRPRRELLERICADIVEAYDLLVDAIRRTLPNGLLVLTTVTDPSDRTGKIPGVTDDRAAGLPLHAMDSFNARVRSIAHGTPNVVLADAYARFLGYGVSVAEPEQWYWRRAMTELNAMGAHQLRLTWLDVLRNTDER
jgi:hypothetical protein